MKKVDQCFLPCIYQHVMESWTQCEWHCPLVTWTSEYVHTSYDIMWCHNTHKQTSQLCHTIMFPQWLRQRQRLLWYMFTWHGLKMACCFGVNQFMWNYIAILVYTYHIIIILWSLRTFPQQLKMFSQELHYNNKEMTFLWADSLTVLDQCKTIICTIIVERITLVMEIV